MKLRWKRAAFCVGCASTPWLGYFSAPVVDYVSNLRRPVCRVMNYFDWDHIATFPTGLILITLSSLAGSFAFKIAARVIRATDASSTDPVHSGDVPPRAACALLCLLMPAKEHVTVLGDFEQTYRTEWLPQFGARGATLMYYWQALRSGMSFWRYAMIAHLIHKAYEWMRMIGS